MDDARQIRPGDRPSVVPISRNIATRIASPSRTQRRRAA
jgi:hypothetical protein